MLICFYFLNKMEYMNINDFNTKVEALMSLSKRTLAELVALHEFGDENKKWCPGISDPPMNCKNISTPVHNGPITVTPVSTPNVSSVSVSDVGITTIAMA